jgi:hypothetical protein
MANSSKKTKNTNKRPNKTSRPLQSGVLEGKWGMCPVCCRSVKRRGIRLRSGRRVNVIEPHWGGQEMCYGSELPWETESCIPVVNEPEHYKITIEEIPCNNTL